MSEHRRKAAILAEIKLAAGCADCGYDAHSEALDFDHLGDKSFTISARLTNTPMAVLLAEVAKCEVVCANCHRVRTQARGQSSPVTASRWYAPYADAMPRAVRIALLAGATEEEAWACVDEE